MTTSYYTRLLKNVCFFTSHTTIPSQPPHFAWDVPSVRTECPASRGNPPSLSNRDGCLFYLTIECKLCESKADFFPPLCASSAIRTVPSTW